MVASTILRGVLRSAMSGAGKGLGGVVRHAGPSALQYAGYSGASSFIDRYAEGNVQTDGGRALAGILSFGLKMKSWQVGLRGVSRTLGAGLSVAGGSRLSHTRVTGYKPYMRLPGETWVTPKREMIFGPRQAPNMLESAGALLGKGGKVDSFLGGLGPVTLGLKGAKLAVKGAGAAVSLPGRAVYGTAEYAGVVGRSFKAKTYKDSWGTLGQGLNAMKFPWAPALMAGAVGGGITAYQRRYNPFTDGGLQVNPGNWEGYAGGMPSVYGTNVFGGSFEQGPIHPENFGGGISFGRPSAIRGSAVQRGQAAVTNSMLKNRRI